MKKNRNNTTPYLIDLHYKYSLNSFEEFYGYGVKYSEIEQFSYIDFKYMMFDKVSENIKFRKFGRYKNKLTIKADMNLEEYDKFISINSMDIIDEDATFNDSIRNPENLTKYVRFNFLHDFVITNIRLITDEERRKFKKKPELTQEDYE